MIRGATIGNNATSTAQASTAPGGADAVKIVLAGLTQFIAVVAKLVGVISDARRFTISEQKLGERFIDQIPGVHRALFEADLLDYGRDEPGRANYVDSHFAEGTGNYGAIINIARQVMTLLFGVRITNGEDLDALDYGVDEYYRRPDKQDIPRAAVERAVFLKQTFFPMSTYNTVQWDLSRFETLPYVAPIPGIEPGTFFNGDIPGGGKIVQGIIELPGTFTPAAQPGGATATESRPGSAAPSGSGSMDRGKVGLIVLAAVAAILIFSGDGK